MTIRETAMRMKADSPLLAATDCSVRNNALAAIAEALKSHSEEIFAANRRDLAAAEAAGLADPIKKRLTFSEKKLADVLNGIAGLISLPDPLGKELLHRYLDEGLELYRISCPIGVIGIIFEARPDALVQISSLCIKSGNCAILKGGSETAETNRTLFGIIRDAAVSAGLPEGCLAQAEARSQISELLECSESVDLLIPRGSNSFVQYIMDNTRIPVMGHADGVCHVYADADADFELAVKVILDSKTQYVSVCNAAETLLVDRNIASKFLPVIIPALRNAHVKLHGDEEAAAAIRLADSSCEVALMSSEDYHTEYLDYEISVRLVDGVDGAIAHINRFGSHHTDCIITRSDETADRFMQLVDSANVYRNCSTRFADGFRYGFGAEVGISTSKLHARGPVGLDGLITYKYKLFGNGHIVADYAEGRKNFNFRDV